MEFRAYKVRWLLLFAIWLTGFNRQFVSTAFTVNNELVVRYFRVTPYEVDLLAIADTITGVFISLLVSLVGSNIGVRAQCIFVSSGMALGNLLSAISFFNRSFYWCLFIGRLISGMSLGMLYTLPAAFANRWFPSNQIGTAFAIPFLGFGFAGAISSLIFALLFPRNTTTINSSIFMNNANKNDISLAQTTFSIVFGVGFAIMVVDTILFIVFSKDRPPSPPSEAEALITSAYKSESNWLDWRSNFMNVTDLLKTKAFLLLTLANFLASSALILFIVLMPSLMCATFPNISSITIANINVLGFVFSSVTTFLAGQMLDRIGSYKTCCWAGAVATAITGFGIYIGHSFEVMLSLYILYPLIFCTRAFTIVTLVEFLVEVTYPRNKTVLMALHFALYNSSFFVMTTVERLSMNAWGASSAALVPSIGNLLAFVSVLFVEPDYRRSKVNKHQLDGVPKDYDLH